MPDLRRAGDRAYRPFCSKHCGDVDLGRWLGGRYAVPGAPVAEQQGDRTKISGARCAILVSTGEERFSISQGLPFEALAFRLAGERAPH